MMLELQPPRFRLLLLSLLVAAGGSACAPSEDSFSLTLLHTNDVHARVMPFSRFGSTCSPQQLAEGGCFGGAARRATLIEEVRRQQEHVLLLDAGDQFQGTLFYSRFKGKEAQQIMNHLGYDAMVVGNHEFDDGPAVLGEFIDGCHFPVLGTNVDASAEPTLAGRLLSYSLASVGGETVGLVGYITEQTALLSRPGGTVRFLPIAESLTPVLAELEAQGVKKIIALSHAGLERDRRVAAAVEGIDVIIGGHTNTLLSNRDPDAEGPYPIVTAGPSGDPVAIVQAFAWGKYLGRLDVGFDRQGRLVSWQGEPLLLDDAVAEHAPTRELLTEMVTEVEAFSSRVIGHTDVDLRGNEHLCRFGECNLGNLICDALLAATSHQGVEIALQNAGGIRSSIPAGDISVGQVLEVLPFANTASTFSLRGSDLWATLEHGVSQAENPDNDGTGRFLQVAGLRYVWTAAAEVGSRILAVEIRQADGSYRPLEPDRLYRVVANNFSREGGDGFTILTERAVDPYDQGRVLADILQSHLQAGSPVAPTLEGRIVKQ